MPFQRMIGAAALMLVAACDAGTRKNEAEGAASSGGQPGNSFAAGKAEEGQLSIAAPGFDMKIDIPQAVTRGAEGGSDSQLIYPNAAVSGLHIQAGAGGDAANSGVELRFASTDPLARVAAWYRDAARRQAFAIASERRDGAALLFFGAQTSGGRFSLRLDPAGGGTQGRLTLSDAQ